MRRDSLDDCFSDSSSSNSEIDSDPENNFDGRTIAVKTSQQRGRPRTRVLNSQLRGRVRTRGGRVRSVRTRRSKQIAAARKRLASVLTDEDQSSDAQSWGSEEEVNFNTDSEWKKDVPKIKTFPLTEHCVKYHNFT